MTEERDSLGSGRSFVDLSHWRKVAVIGGDALEWLDSLISADISGLAPGAARPSLLLSPTGQVRAEFTVTEPGGTLLLIQDPEQPRSVLDLLSPYVLSSDVSLEDRTLDLALLSFPSVDDPPAALEGFVSTPSILGSGVDLILPESDRDRVEAILAGSFRPVGGEEVEAWRILQRRPRLGVDVVPEDLPQEAGLEGEVSFDKGCFLGQEAVARVRNLGHPRRVVVAVQANGVLSAGDPILCGDDEAGTITSAAVIDGSAYAMARVGWQWRAGPFR